MKPDSLSQQSAASAVSIDAKHQTGLGLPEALVWVAGYVIAQVLVAMLLVAILLVAAFEGRPISVANVKDVLRQANGEELRQIVVLVTGGVTLGAVLLIVPAAILRLRPTPRLALGMQAPSSHQLVLLAGAVLPLMMLSNELYRAALCISDVLKQRLGSVFPEIQSLVVDDTVSLIREQADVTPYWLLLMIAGVGPAIGEELVFRGVIGRGLVARWGLVPGMVLTAILFAVAHGTLAHAVATLPIALFLHVAYLTTGSLWAPIFVHFANNALAVSLMKLDVSDHVPVSWTVIGSAAVYVVAMSVLLGQSQSSQGTWNDEADQAHPAFPTWGVVLAGSGALTFTGSFCWSALAAL